MVAQNRRHQVQVITKEGECKLDITLDININITTDKIEVNVVGGKGVETDESVHWAIPDFENEQSEKIDFGKKVE